MKTLKGWRMYEEKKTNFHVFMDMDFYFNSSIIWKVVIDGQKY